MISLTEYGGKAAALHRLAEAGFPVPAWFVMLPGEPVSAVADRLSGLSGEFFAVRSSAAGEDSAEHSFAGQLESWLFVPRTAVAARVEAVRQSGQSERVHEYRRQRGLCGPAPVPAVIVQEMIDADSAGVAFSADPVSGQRDHAVVSAVPGLGTALVSGEADADSWVVSRAPAILSRGIAQKPRAHRAAPDESEGVRWEPVGEPGAACLTDAAVLAVADMARRAAVFAGVPQDIEWAWRGGQLWLLQSRPVTSLHGMPDPADDLCVWDNSNISESYSGVTTPLTFSFARRAYENAYREFCRLFSVPESRITAAAPVYAGMLGLIRGRIYYNLLNWYRVLAMLPGFQLNRSFMEQMMGVREPLPEELVARVVQEQRSGSRLREWGRLARSLLALVRKHRALPRDIGRFYERLNVALADPVQIGIFRRIQRFQRMPRALENAAADTSLDVLEEPGIPAQPPHDKAAEEHPEQPPPAPRVPRAPVEVRTVRGTARIQQGQHRAPGVHQRQHPFPEQLEIALEFPGPAMPCRDDVRARIPERPRRVRQQRRTALIERRAILTRPRSEKLEEFPVLQHPPCGAPQLHAGELRGIQIHRHHLLCPGGQKG